MADNDAKSNPSASAAGFKELFRYRKGDELRIYKLRVVPQGVELWRTTERDGEPPVSIEEDDFSSVDDAIRTLEELEQRLNAGGWRPG
ncbi:MAG TPA: hypothetical protein VJ813_18785 [Vicinamibacterales bacterium]|nr:hypothetical protein [Vicinamibacterales bacterium]